MSKHYISVDDEGRIIDGFSDFYREPQASDICIRENAGNEFELFGKDFNRRLYFPVGEKKIWQWKYVDGKIKFRSKEEQEVDYPPLPRTPSVEEQLQSNTEDIATLAEAIKIIMEVN